MARNTGTLKHGQNCGRLALLIAVGACDSVPGPGDEHNLDGAGGDAISDGTGGSNTSGGESANPNGGSNANGGESAAPSGGTQPADGGATSPSGGASLGDGGDAPGGFGGETGGAVHGSGGGSGGAANDGSGGMSSGGQAAVNLCVTFVDRSEAAADRQINWNFGIDLDDERCLQIRIGQSVTWSGNFAFHPLSGNGGTTPNPILPNEEGSGLFSVQFEAEGTFGFICESHVEMRGAVRVVP